MGLRLLPVLLLALKLSSVFADGQNWWKSAVIYQIYPRSFKDTDGNGIGDLQGIIDSIDYIKDIGVDAVWLSPIYPTADKDFGYDITDMKNVYSILGNMSQFEELVTKLHKIGIKIILDFVPNHTSDQHDWFKRSMKANDKYKDYYVWKDPEPNMQPPNNWVPTISKGSAWKYDKFRKQFYLHQFLTEQPDLNYENPEVLKEILSVLEFWLNKHIDGFRMDAVHAICESQDFGDEQVGEHGERYHEKTWDQPKTLDILAQFRAKLDEFTKIDNVTRIMMVENYNSNPYIIKKYYGTNEVPIAHFPFNFYVIMNITKDSNASDWAHCINEYYTALGKENWPNWVLGNHDQHRVATRFSELHVDLLNIINLVLKGTAVTYFGEEFGMPDSLVRQDQAQDPQGKNLSFSDFMWNSRDFERGPFLWNTNTTAGFSSNLNTWVPVSPSYWRINIAAQNKSERSHLKIYKDMIALRKNLTLMYGDVDAHYLNANVLAIYRYYYDNPTVVAVINLGDIIETVDLTSKRKSLPKQLHFYTASLNINDFKDKNNKLKVYNSTSLTIPPKGAIVLSTLPFK
uniref:alpha-glucosidase n=1 Tax=Pristhesancus plagipennis TaxID=1955184 RepID=A0A2K8JSD1_PRIPG|nr:secreted Alpha amylase protein [Pristhesancus plagipennis]